MWSIEFFQDDDGAQPAREFLDDLPSAKRVALIAAIEEVLGRLGLDVCGTEYGRQLGDGLFEFRVRRKELLLRVFCHAYGDRIVLLLGGYDKGDDPSPRRQSREIERARKRLRSFKLREQRRRAAERRRR